MIDDALSVDISHMPEFAEMFSEHGGFYPQALTYNKTRANFVQTGMQVSIRIYGSCELYNMTNVRIPNLIPVLYVVPIVYVQSFIFVLACTKKQRCYGS